MLAAYKALEHVVEIESGQTSGEEAQRVRAARGEAVRVPAAGHRAVRGGGGGGGRGRGRAYRDGRCEHRAQQLREHLQTAHQAMWLSERLQSTIRPAQRHKQHYS